jgi:hypothetical protein
MFMKAFHLAAGITFLVLAACSKPEVTPKSAKEVSPPSGNSAKPEVAVAPVTTPFAPIKSYEGPFGLAMGISTSELVDVLGFKVSPDNPNVYSGTPPKPVTGMSYIVIATKEQGLCKIAASIDLENINATGDQIKSETDRITEIIEVKYGKHTDKYDFAGQDVYKRNSQYWMMGLKEDAVTYAYAWDGSKKGVHLPNNLIEIFVKAKGVSMSQGYVNISYTFDNKEICAKEIKKQKSSNM